MKEDRGSSVRLRKSSSSSGSMLKQDSTSRKAANVRDAMRRTRLQEVLSQGEEKPKELSLHDEVRILFDRYVTNHIARELLPLYSPLGEEEIEASEARAITKFYKGLADFQDYLKTNYRRQLWVKDAYYPRKWMEEDPQISAKCQRFKMIEVLNFIDKEALDRKDQKASQIAKGKKFERVVQSGKQKGKIEAVEYSLVLANKEFYQRAKEVLGLEQISVQKYMKRFRDIGVLKSLGRAGKDNREMLYADGYYVDWRDRKRKIRFLSANMRKGLREFELS